MIERTKGQSEMRLANKVNFGIATMILSYGALLALMEPDDLIILLNGLLSGSMIALAVAYYRLVAAAILGDGEYDRGRQYGLGSFLTSLAILCGLVTSVWVRTMDLPTTTFVATSLARWLAIWGAVLKITSPDFGSGLLYGSRRKVMWLSIAAGVGVAVVVIWMQV